jgi:uncharacterized membrane protein YjjP (DUF1212 family)
VINRTFLGQMTDGLELAYFFTPPPFRRMGRLGLTRDPHALRGAAPRGATMQTDRDLIVQLGVALHRAGAPTHRIEDSINGLSQTLGLTLDVLATPTSLIFGFADGTSRLRRLEPGDLRLHRIDALSEVIAQLGEGSITAAAAAQAIEAIENRPTPYPAWLSALAMMTSAGAAAQLFDGGWREMAVAATAGLGLAGLIRWFAPRKRSVQVLEPIAAFAIAGLAGLGSHLFEAYTPGPALLAGLIILLPGLRATTGLIELAAGHLVAGSARLASAAMSLMMLLAGTALGRAALQLAPAAPTVGSSQPLPPLAQPACVAVAVLSLCVVFAAPRRDVIRVTLFGSIVFYVAGGLVEVTHPTFAAGVAALVLGVLANISSRVSRRSAVTTLVPGLTVLVPGSLSYLGVDALIQHDLSAGLSRAIEAGGVAIALVSGLLLAQLVLPPRREL